MSNQANPSGKIISLPQGGGALSSIGEKFSPDLHTGTGDTSDRFLVHVDFKYEERPDPFPDYRAGFEIRTTRRCRAIKITTQTEDGTTHPVREYRFSYTTYPYNGASLLHQLDIIGYDDAGNAYDNDEPDTDHPKQLPPLTFGYTQFVPEKRRFEVVEDRDVDLIIKGSNPHHMTKSRISSGPETQGPFRRCQHPCSQLPTARGIQGGPTACARQRPEGACPEHLGQGLVTEEVFPSFFFHSRAAASSNKTQQSLPLVAGTPTRCAVRRPCALHSVSGQDWPL